ncbi:MAG: putative bifunctional diguanylate cyclase/phosphodiesterase [Burkholderiaceae bacterium]
MITTQPSALHAQLRNDAETELARNPPVAAPILTPEELLHEIQVHQVELEIQNEALLLARAALEESRDRYYALYEFAPVTYLSLSDTGLIAEINLTGATQLGEERSRLLQRRFSGFIAAEDGDRWHLFFRSALQQHDRQSCELLLQRSDGSRFHARLDCGRSKDKASLLSIALTDITDSKCAEELRIAAIAFESQEGMIVADQKGVIIRVNQAFTRLTGYSPEEAIGQTSALLSSGRHDQAFYRRMWQVLLEKGYWQGEVWNRRKNGKIYAEWLTISAVIAPDGTTTHYVGTFSEITKNKEAEAEIHRLAYYDPLTHLPNRRLLHDRIGQAMAGSRRDGHYCALLFLDLDNFKNINDSGGHEIGDQLLVETVRRIQATVRAGDSTARLGGDEFVVMLEDLSADAREAAVQIDLVGEKIREILALPYTLGGRQFHCSASLGVALFRGCEASVDTLLKHADLAMYKAKSAGRNTLRFFDPAMQIALDQRSALEADLRLAVGQGQLRLYYQPQVDVQRRVIGAEALLRWSHPKRGLVPPDDFIGLAEETGLILPIGLWVLETACAQIKAWSADPAACTLRLAVNVSVRQFRQPEFVAQVRQVLAQTGANPTLLKIELTESLMIDNVADTITRMNALKALGIRFSIDDFGTGFSSLSYLKRLPLDQLKIDRAFVRDIAHDSSDAAIVHTIITLGKSLGLEVIAEGVETESQLERLRVYGCIAYQGYLFARPLPLAKFDTFVQRSNNPVSTAVSDVSVCDSEVIRAILPF